MAVLRDFKCSEHGIYESWNGDCPECGVKGERVYISAPAYHGSRTRNIDKTLKGLAKDFGMTNIKSTREGEHQSGYLARNNSSLNKEETAIVKAHAEKQYGEQRPGNGAIWGGGFQGLNMGNVLSGRAVQSIKGESVGIRPSEAGITRGPMTDPKATFRDHENLTIKK